jgi:hypothetical protein
VLGNGMMSWMKVRLNVLLSPSRVWSAESSLDPLPPNRDPAPSPQREPHTSRSFSQRLQLVCCLLSANCIRAAQAVMVQLKRVNSFDSWFPPEEQLESSNRPSIPPAVDSLLEPISEIVTVDVSPLHSHLNWRHSEQTHVGCHASPGFSNRLNRLSGRTP